MMTSCSPRTPDKLVQFDYKSKGNRYCLVSIQIGGVYENDWALAFRKSWHGYAQRHGYDIAIVKDFIDCSAGTDTPGIKFQKLKLLQVPELGAYEKVVYLDSDVLLLEHAPCIAANTLSGKLGMVSQINIPYKDWYRYIQPIRVGESSVDDYYKTHLLPDEMSITRGIKDVFNGGVMVMEPAAHSSAFEHIFQKYKNSIQQKKGHIDQPLVTCEMMRRGLIQSLDFRFNVIFSMWFSLFYGFIPDDEKELVRNALRQTLPLVFFLHFPTMRGVEHLPSRYFDRTNLKVNQ